MRLTNFRRETRRFRYSNMAGTEKVPALIISSIQLGMISVWNERSGHLFSDKVESWNSVEKLFKLLGFLVGPFWQRMHKTIIVGSFWSDVNLTLNGRSTFCTSCAISAKLLRRMWHRTLYPSFGHYIRSKLKLCVFLTWSGAPTWDVPVLLFSAHISSVLRFFPNSAKSPSWWSPPDYFTSNCIRSKLRFYIRSKLRFTKEEAKIRKYCALLPNFWRYNRTIFHFTKEKAEVRKMRSHITELLTLYPKWIVFY